MFNLVEELFAPGRRHTEEERQRLEHTRVEAGSNDPGEGPIDLRSGQVLIRPRRGGEPGPGGPERAPEARESSRERGPGGCTRIV